MQLRCVDHAAVVGHELSEILTEGECGGDVERVEGPQLGRRKRAGDGIELPVRLDEGRIRWTACWGSPPPRQPLSEPLARPATIQRCTTMNRITAGTALTMLAAISWFQSGSWFSAR